MELQGYRLSTVYSFVRSVSTIKSLHVITIPLNSGKVKRFSKDSLQKHAKVTFGILFGILWSGLWYTTQ